MVKESINPHVSVGFSTTNKLISRFIRWITKSDVSHAWIAFDDETLNQRFVMQAESWGYEIRPWERWKKENTLVSEFVLLIGTDRIISGLRWISKKLGSDYDYGSAILSGLRRYLGVWLKNKRSSPKSLMCSEAVVRFIQHMELDTCRDFDPETTTPAKLLSEIRATMAGRREFAPRNL